MKQSAAPRRPLTRLPRLRWKLALVAALATHGPGALAQALAQERDGGEDGRDDGAAPVQLEEVVVLGQKIERSLQDTASSVAVFDARTIDSQNFIFLEDLLNQTANVTSLFDGAVLTIRGVRNDGASGADSTSDVSAVYVDGVFLPSQLFTSGALNLWDIESAEIFRGPQSTIQGRNALAGAVVLNTVDPSYEFEGSAQALYGDYGTWRGSAAISVPLIADEFALRFAIDESRTDGFIENRTLMTDASDASEASTFRAKALWEPAAIENLTVRLNYSKIDAFEGDGRINSELFPAERVTFENIQSRIENEGDIVSLDVSYGLNDRWDVTAISAYTQTQERFFVDGTRDASGGPSANETISDDELFSQEVRATFSGARARGLVGLYYFDQEGGLVNNSNSLISSEFAFPDPVTFASLLFQTPMPSPEQIGQAGTLRETIVTLVPQFPVLFDRASDLAITNYAAFGEFDYDLNDRWTLTAGLRYDREDISQNVFDSTFVPPITTGDPTLDPILAGVAAQFSNTIAIDAVDNDFDAWLPKVGLTYRWTDHLATSFTYQRGYRAGGLSINTFRAALAPRGASQDDLEAAGIVNSFEPEFTNNYELALRSQFFDNRLTLNANAFYIDYTDQQVSVQLSQNPLDTLTENVGQSELYGFEADVSALLGDRLRLGGYLGYVSTEFTDGGDVLDDVIGAGLDLTGLEFTYAPAWTAGAYARYEWAEGWFVNGRVRYQDESFTLVQNDPLAVNDGFTVVDLLAGYEARVWRAELFVNNALDENYFTGNFGPTFNDVSLVGPPRLIGARALIRF